MRGRPVLVASNAHRVSHLLSIACRSLTELQRCYRGSWPATSRPGGRPCGNVHRAAPLSAHRRDFQSASNWSRMQQDAAGCRRTARALGPQDGSRQLRFACDEWLLASRGVVELLIHEPQAAAAMKTCLLADARLDFQLHLTGSRIRPPFDRPDTTGSIVPFRVS